MRRIPYIVAFVLLITIPTANAQVYTPTSTVLQSNNSYIGIGTPDPIAPLQIRFATNNNINEVGFVIDRMNGSSTSTSPRGVGLVFKDGSNNTFVGGIVGVRQNPNAHYNGDLAFFTNNTGASSASSFASMSERLRIKANGFVGIGTTNPTTLLDLSSNLKLGLISQFPAEGSVSEGDWGNYIIGDILTGQRLRLGVSNDLYTRAEISLDNNNLAAGTISFKTANGNGGTAVRMFVRGDGNIGIGTTNPGSLLSVNGKIAATEINVKVDVTAPDYVFEPDYDLLPLTELERYIMKNKHLPEVPSAAEMTNDGLNLKEMNLLLLKKVEELTLHMIDMKKEIETLKANQKSKKE